MKVLGIRLAMEIWFDCFSDHPIISLKIVHSTHCSSYELESVPDWVHSSSVHGDRHIFSKISRGSTVFGLASNKENSVTSYQTLAYYSICSQYMCHLITFFSSSNLFQIVHWIKATDVTLILPLDQNKSKFKIILYVFAQNKQKNVNFSPITSWFENVHVRLLCT